jgi:superfamily II DNA or RNA helicase
VFSDLKFGNYGAKMLASAFIAKGHHLGYSAAKKGNVEKTKENEEEEEEIKMGGADDDDDDEEKKTRKKRYQKIEIFSDSVLKQNKNDNFFMLSSTTVYDQSITVAMKKTMLAKFNQRPENVHGELVRFIILDSGFKEGIDLFDIKYIHIFEPSTIPADEKQVIGRGTRTCGQKRFGISSYTGLATSRFCL